MKQIILHVTVVLLLTGCYVDEKFERPEVVSVTPGKDSIAAVSESKVKIEFSKPMDTVKTNGEFTLSSGSGVVDGYFSWDNGGKLMTFTPKIAFSMSEKYSIQITESAEDKDGNDLKEEFISVFYTGGDLGRPVVLSHSPEENSIGNREHCAVAVRFSESVDMNSVYNGINISPAVQGTFSSNADSTEITFTPLYGFSYGVTYTVNVTNSITDSCGNKLLIPVVYNFTVGDDFIKPTLAAYQNLVPPLNFDEYSIVNGAEKDRDVAIDFSEQILTDNLANAVSISPSSTFYISTSNILAGGVTVTRGVIHFTEELQSGLVYTLRISSSVADLQGNPLDHDYRFVFVTNGSGSIQPVVTGIGDISVSAVNYWQKNEVQPLSLGGILYDNIGIDFSSPVDPATLVIRADSVAGHGGGISVVNIDWPSEAGIQFKRLKFGLYGITAGNTYRITVKGGKNGLKDINNNYMKNDFVQLIKF